MASYRDNSLNLNELPVPKESEAALEGAKKQALDVCHILENARAKLSGPEEALGELQKELAADKARYESIKERLDHFCGQLEEAEKQRSGDELQTNIETAQTLLSEQEKVLTELRNLEPNARMSRLSNSKPA